MFRYIFKNSKKTGLQELGPRFTLKMRSLQKGTFNSKFGEYEWIHKVGESFIFFELIYANICGNQEAWFTLQRNEKLYFKAELIDLRFAHLLQSKRISCNITNQLPALILLYFMLFSLKLKTVYCSAVCRFSKMKCVNGKMHKFFCFT